MKVLDDAVEAERLMSRLGSAGTRGTVVDTPQRAPRPILWWASIGALLWAVMFYTLARWIGAWDFQHAPFGPDNISDSKIVRLRIYEAISFSSALFVLIRYLILPWRREGRLTLDGMIVIGSATTLFWDPLINATNMTFGYNGHHLLAVESWLQYMPFVPYATAEHFPESPLFMGAYIYWVYASVLAGCWILRKMKERYPQVGLIWGYTAIFVTFFVLDLAVENGIIIRQLEAWTYVGVVENLTLWSGDRYQMPLYMCALAAAWAVLLTAIRYHRDDRGHSLVERGADDLRVSTRSRTFLRFLAVTGAIQTTVIVLYIPWQLIGLSADSSPDNIPSYLLNGMCGEATEYACPGAEVPIPINDSIHIGPLDPRLGDD